LDIFVEMGLVFVVCFGYGSILFIITYMAEVPDAVMPEAESEILKDKLS
jgi:hypothetical protein